ncbi:MAG TPA: hypothetical protein VJU86_06365 [Pyrinomonadaceae bacterium]|nr:hypothetical protein [Pyrinomonadaceae bacterium]
MKVLVRMWLCLCLLVMFSTLCVAQEKIEISTNPPPPMPQWPVIKEVGKAKALYNERGNKTIVQTGAIQVQGDWRNGLRFRAGFEVSGKEVVKPSDVTLSFFSASSDRTYADNRALRILIDGKEALSGVAQYKNGNTNGEVFLINVTQEIPYELFLRLVSAKNVKISVGPTEFALKDSDLEALKDLQRILE